jgi:glycosyltransferase involved in cell wall biosynthesis
MSKIAVMHVLDTLALGGAERAAINLVNHLPRQTYRPYLCTTRTEGPLADVVEADVGRIALGRRRRFESSALRSLVNFILTEEIRILHAHGSSLFIAALAAAFRPHPIVIWHAHYGRVAMEDRRAWMHRLAILRTEGVIAVNHQLAEWCVHRLAMPAEKIWCVPNMVCTPAIGSETPDLPGVHGSRIVCVANLRAEKDHPNLIRAMALVVRRRPKTHLLLVGANSDPTYSASSAYFEAVKQEIARYSLERNVSFLGQRRDVPSVLRACDVGVLSSKTEGLPVSLLEYGMAGLPVVATRVGECEEVLDHGRAGILVSPQSPAELAEALLSLLNSHERRVTLGETFLRLVQQRYSAPSIIELVCQVYDAVLQSKRTETVCPQPVQDRFRA